MGFRLARVLEHPSENSKAALYRRLPTGLAILSTPEAVYSKQRIMSIPWIVGIEVLEIFYHGNQRPTSDGTPWSEV